MDLKDGIKEAAKAITEVATKGEGYGTVTVKICGRNVVRVKKESEADLTK